MRSALASFFVEATELLADMEAGLLDLEGSDGDPELVNAVFRAAHTIKGSAGLFGLDDIIGLTHVMESVLDRVRAGEVAITTDLVEVLLPSKDAIAAMVQAHAAGHEVSAADAAAADELRSALSGFLAESAEGVHAPVEHHLASGERLVHVSVRFGPECLRGGMDPIPFLDFLGNLGTVVAVATMDGQLPELALLDPEVCYLGFEVTMRTQADAAAILDVFEFVRDESDIRVVDAATDRSEVEALVASYGPDGDRVRAMLAKVAGPLAVGGDSDGGATGGRSRAGGGASGDRQGAADGRTIRVDAARLDRLIDTVGEMVIAGAGANLHASASGNETLKAAIAEVMRLIEGVRDDALRLRMVPIGTTFGRFHRVVRDVSASLGKDVALTITGGDTEVDKALVEQIGDPLLHLVRNALDHGIESVADRLARGKPAGGSLTLRAFHDSGSIVVEVADDGGGIDTARVLAKAVERGIVEPGANLSDHEVFNLIFEPGFSTADQVSDLSGRGVGMDVVKRNVMALRGTIDVESSLGVGTTVRIRLPLTLAIIDGFMVGVGNTMMVIPLDRVVECVERPAAAKHREYMDLRGKVLPLIPMRSWMQVDGEPPRRENVVVVDHGGMRAGLVVDSLHGEFQTVIKPLGPMFAQARGIGGSTILGNGDVALIVDVPVLVGRAVADAAARPLAS